MASRATPVADTIDLLSFLDGRVRAAYFSTAAPYFDAESRNRYAVVPGPKGGRRTGGYLLNGRDATRHGSAGAWAPSNSPLGCCSGDGCHWGTPSSTRAW